MSRKFFIESEVLTPLLQELNLKKEEVNIEYLKYYDTFDYRLYENSLTLFSKGQDIYLKKLNSNKDRALNSTSLNFNSLNNLEDTQIQKELKEYIYPREILNIFDIEYIQTTLSNREFEFRVNSYNYFIQNSKKSASLSEVVIKRDKKSKKFIKLLKSKALQVDIAKFGLKKLNIDYIKSSRVKLNRNDDANLSFREILKELLNIIKLNERGVKEAIDIEFLHDFRIALRKSRALLNYAKGVFSKEDILKYKQDLSYIAKVTNHCRDLDVYLLDIESEKNSLPENLRDDLNILIDILKDEQRVEREKIGNFLNSKEYQEIVSNWESFLNRADESKLSTIEVAKNNLLKIHRKVLQKSEAIDKNTQAEAMHELRIDFKKFRYLVTFFAPLFEGNEIFKDMVSISKSIQSHLGDFQDLEVQQSKLKSYSKIIIDRGFKNIETILVLGKLFVDLNTKQSELKSNFYPIFKKFKTKEEAFIQSIKTI